MKPELEVTCSWTDLPLHSKTISHEKILTQYCTLQWLKPFPFCFLPLRSFWEVLHKTHKENSLVTLSFVYFQFQLICERCSYLDWFHQHICSSKQMGPVKSCQTDGRTTVMSFSMHFCLSCQQSFFPQLRLCLLSYGLDIFVSIQKIKRTMVGCLAKFELIVV